MLLALVLIKCNSNCLNATDAPHTGQYKHISKENCGLSLQCCSMWNIFSSIRCETFRFSYTLSKMECFECLFFITSLLKMLFLSFLTSSANLNVWWLSGMLIHFCYFPTQVDLFPLMIHGTYSVLCDYILYHNLCRRQTKLSIMSWNSKTLLHSSPLL